MLGACISMLLPGCFHRVHKNNAVLTSERQAMVVVVRFVAGFYPDQKQAMAIVDPAALEVGHIWKCEADLEPYYFQACVKRIGINDVGVSAGDGTREEIDVVFSGALVMNEHAPPLDVVVSSPTLHEIVFSVIAADKEAALKEKAKEKGITLITCIAFNPETSSPQP